MNPSNPIVLTCYNRTPAQLDLSKRAVQSALDQDIPIDLYLIDNGSTAPTWEWMLSLAATHSNITIIHHDTNQSPVALSNEWMARIFAMGHSYLLGMPNDVVLPSNFYRQLLTFPRGVVTASMTSGEVTPCESARAVHTCTPLAVALIRRWAYDALMVKDGYFFDPKFFLYGSDCCVALRLSACGIVGVQLDIQYFHYGSASHRLAPPTDQLASMSYGADLDRAYFERKWGFRVDAPEYSAAALNINFKGEPLI